MEKKKPIKKSIKLDYNKEYDEYLIYLVTQVGFGKDGHPWYNIRAICSTEERAKLYKENFERYEKEVYGEDVKTTFDVEGWGLDHARGANKWYFKKVK